jgi:hypothetical protein
MHVLLLALSVALCRLVHNAVYLLGNYMYRFQTLASYGKVAGEQYSTAGVREPFSLASETMTTAVAPGVLPAQLQSCAGSMQHSTKSCLGLPAFPAVQWQHLYYAMIAALLIALLLMLLLLLGVVLPQMPC